MFRSQLIHSGETAIIVIVFCFQILYCSVTKALFICIIKKPTQYNNEVASTIYTKYAFPVFEMQNHTPIFPTVQTMDTIAATR